MNNRRDIVPTLQDGAPTMAAPAAGQQQGAWSQHDPYGGPGAYPPYGQPPPDMYYDQQPPIYGQAPVLPPAQLPVCRRPGVVFGVAAVAAVAAVGALLATWMSHDNVSTTPANTTGTPSQQVQVPLVPAPPSQPVIVQQPVPRQQAPAPRVAPANPSVVSPAPVSPNSPVPAPNPNPEQQQQQQQPDSEQQKQDPEQQQKQNPPPDTHNPGDPENPTPDDSLCHPNPPGCTGDQKAPQKDEQQQQQPAP